MSAAGKRQVRFKLHQRRARLKMLRRRGRRAIMRTRVVGAAALIAFNVTGVAPAGAATWHRDRVRPQQPRVSGATAKEPRAAAKPKTDAAVTPSVAVGSTVFFVGYDPAHGSELWKSDGTAAGTVLVKDINPVTYAGYGPRDLTAVGGVLFFTADDGVHGRELWKSDGTASGTMLVQDINPGSGDSSSPYSTNNMVAVGGAVYFRLS